MSNTRWRKLTAPQKVASAACAAAVVVWTAVWVAPDAHEAQRESSEQAEPAVAASPSSSPGSPSPSAAEPTALAPSPRSAAAARDSTPPSSAESDPLLALREALASDNAGTRIGAVRKLATQRTQAALPELLQRDLASDPELAPTLIQVSAQLARRADASQRTAAAFQLSRWLFTESARPDQAARGNVSVLVEALSSLDSPDAEAALIKVLQDQDQPLHVQTLAVEGLARRGSPAAQAALAEFRAQLDRVERQGFERELQREAEQATDRALARLSR